MKFLFAISALLASILFQSYFEIKVTEGFISALLTVFSLFFTLYIASFTVFAGSKFMADLHKIEDKNNRSRTILDTLLLKVKNLAILLLFSILYLIAVYALILMKRDYEMYPLFLLWGVVAVNFYYTYRTIGIFADIVRQTATRRPDNR